MLRRGMCLNHANINLNLMNYQEEMTEKDQKGQLVINVDEEARFLSTQEQGLFVSDLAMQCGNLLHWVTQPSNSALISEGIWKNQMRVKASNQYPELDNEEIRRLVDRDWKVMSEENRQAIISKYLKPKTESQLISRAKALHAKIESLRQGQGLTNQ